MTDIEICADLACMNLDADDIADTTAAVDKMIEYFAVMDSANVDATTVERQALRSDDLRADSQADDPAVRADILAQAPELEDNFIVIPNVL